MIFESREEYEKDRISRPLYWAWMDAFYAIKKDHYGMSLKICELEGHPKKSSNPILFDCDCWPKLDNLYDNARKSDLAYKDRE